MSRKSQSPSALVKSCLRASVLPTLAIAERRQRILLRAGEFASISALRAEPGPLATPQSAAGRSAHRGQPIGSPPHFCDWARCASEPTHAAAAPSNDAAQQEPMADFTTTPEDMKSLVAELQAAGAAAQQLERQKNAASDFKRQFDCAPGALALVVGHNGQRLREIEASTGARVRCAQDPGRRRIRSGARVLIEGATRDAVESAAALVESSLELAKSPQQIIIPRSALGRVIGRNGERIKSVIERSGAQCRVQQDVDPCFVEIASEDPMTLQVAREMVLSFLESGLQSGTWDLEEACRAKAAATLAPHQARMLANLSSPLDPSRAALARQPVGREVVAEQMVDPYKFADAQWACARDAEGRLYYYNAMTGQSTWEAPPGFKAPA